MLSFFWRARQNGAMAGKREASRQRIDADIMRAARSQLAEVGATGLSLREIAREVGMVSSAVYRYVDSRDALLTRLIIEAYDALGGDVERASADHADSTDLDRWTAACLAMRSWAVENPHEYLLLYGSPVPGYAAPTDTVDPGVRPTLALARIVGDAAAADRLQPANVASPTDPLDDEVARVIEYVDIDITAAHAAAFLIAWTQMFGLVSFELTNQTRGIVDSHQQFFEFAVRATGTAIGLR
jgi:AcrR family transcriptional regulator